MNSAKVCKILKFSLHCSVRKCCRTSWTVGRYHRPANNHNRRVAGVRVSDQGRGGGGAGRAGGPGILLCGVMGWLGLSKDDPIEEDNLTTTVKMAVLAVQEGNLVNADRLLHIALKLANDMQHQAAVTHIYCLMGNLALERGLVGQAERLYTTVLKRILAVGEEQDSNAVVEISLKLAQIFLARGELAKAEEGFRFCSESQQKKVSVSGTEVDEDTLALYGMALDLQAQFFMAGGRLKEAETAWREAVLVATKLHGVEGEQVLVVTNSLATVLSLQGQDISAAQLLVGVVEAAQRLDTPHLTSYLVNLGLVRMKQGMLEVARDSCGEARKKAVEVADKEVIAEADQCLEEVKLLLQEKQKQ
eukprot:GFUD01007326.1.p1 GENE.GFUD01007326.1~~GFUD01007326.1.p1  ORF type:complete len:361 (+),score=138.79 GFUD01007326.1:47-1129(+)